MGSELVVQPPRKRRKPRPRKVGRPGLMTEETQARFLQELGRGVNVSWASRAAGLKPDTVEKWIARGKGKLAPERPATPEYVAFVEAVEMAKAGVITKLAGYAMAGAEKDPRIAIQLLDRFSRQWSWAPPVLLDTPDYDEDDERYLRPGPNHALPPPPPDEETEPPEPTVTMRERTITIPASRLDAFSRLLRGKDPDVDAAASRLARFSESEDLPPT